MNEIDSSNINPFLFASQKTVLILCIIPVELLTSPKCYIRHKESTELHNLLTNSTSHLWISGIQHHHFQWKHTVHLHPKINSRTVHKLTWEPSLIEIYKATTPTLESNTLLLKWMKYQLLRHIIFSTKRSGLQGRTQHRTWVYTCTQYSR